MRKEMVQYTPRSRVRRGVHAIAGSCSMPLEAARRRAYSVMEVGSPMWHRTQKRLSRLSSVEPHMGRRVGFYEVSMPDWGVDCRVYPGVAFYYPTNLSVGH